MRSKSEEIQGDGIMAFEVPVSFQSSNPLNRNNNNNNDRKNLKVFELIHNDKGRL